MSRGKRQNLLFALGVAAALIYGAVAYFALCDQSWEKLATFSFLVLVPVALALVPLLFMSDEDLVRTFGAWVFAPFIAVLGLFVLFFSLHIEGLMCLLIIGAPFVLSISFTLWVISAIGRHRRKKAIKPVVPVLMLLPFLTAGPEVRWRSRAETGRVERSIAIAASPATIWQNIVEVRPIAAAEYPASFLDQLGIPRPWFAKVDRAAVGGVRVGTFRGGLRFREAIVDYQAERSLGLRVAVDATSIPSDPSLEHALAQRLFALSRVGYRLEPEANGTTRLVLSCEYQLSSALNSYGNFWARLIIGDFEARLLSVIGARSLGTARAPFPTRLASAHRQ